MTLVATTVARWQNCRLNNSIHAPYIFLGRKKGFSKSYRKEAGKYIRQIYKGTPPYFMAFLQLLIVINIKVNN
jgi:hypothetical protein